MAETEHTLPRLSTTTTGTKRELADDPHAMAFSADLPTSVVPVAAPKPPAAASLPDAVVGGSAAVELPVAAAGVASQSAMGDDQGEPPIISPKTSAIGETSPRVSTRPLASY